LSADVSNSGTLCFLLFHTNTLSHARGNTHTNTHTHTHTLYHPQAQTHTPRLSFISPLLLKLYFFLSFSQIPLLPLSLFPSLFNSQYFPLFLLFSLPSLFPVHLSFILCISLSLQFIPLNISLFLSLFLLSRLANVANAHSSYTFPMC
jgi:hypothetical protein